MVTCQIDDRFIRSKTTISIFLFSSDNSIAFLQQPKYSGVWKNECVQHSTKITLKKTRERKIAYREDLSNLLQENSYCFKSSSVVAQSSAVTLSIRFPKNTMDRVAVSARSA